MPEIMTLWQKRESPYTPATAVAEHALGILRKVIVEQHFIARGGRLERFTSLPRDNAQLDDLLGREGAGAQRVGLAVTERTALFLHGGRLQVIRDNTAHVIV